MIGAITFPVLVKEGAFEVKLNRLRPDNYRMKLTTLHVNGGTMTTPFNLTINGEGEPDLAALREAWENGAVDRIEQAVARRNPEAAQRLAVQETLSADHPEVLRKLQVLRGVLEPVPPVDLGAVTGAGIFLSDVAWTKAEVGWGKAARNYFWFDDKIQNGVFLTLGGRFYDKGLYAHAPSCYEFAVDGKWETFTATVGLRDGAEAQGSAVFTLSGDGRELYRSAILRAGASAEVKLDISQVKRLELRADGGEGHPHNSWAIWADPKVTR